MGAEGKLEPSPFLLCVLGNVGLAHTRMCSYHLFEDFLKRKLRSELKGSQSSRPEAGKEHGRVQLGAQVWRPSRPPLTLAAGLIVP